MYPAQAITTISSPLMWAGFIAFMLAAMVIDLGVTKRSRVMTTRTAVTWCVVWVSTALAFNVGLYYYFGVEKAEEFFAGYLLEYSLSVDNLFVFLLVFGFFKTPQKLQHRALVWGIIGAMLMRATMILAGAALIQRFHFMMAVFGAFLLYTGVKLLFHDDDADPSDSAMVRFLQRRLPLTDSYVGENFTTRIEEPGPDGKPVPRFKFTRLFLVVLVIECSDVIFAVDSVPAIFGITEDPFIVFTSNMFAILGLRSLFFALAGAIQKLRFLNYGLSLILSFIGVKMLLPFIPAVLAKAGIESGLSAESLHLSTATSLGVICTVLITTTALSLLTSPPPAPPEEKPADEAGAESGAAPVGEAPAEEAAAAPTGEAEPPQNASSEGA